MSDFRIDKITNRDGSAGTQIAGISTFSGTSGMVMPGGSTAYRGGRGRMIIAGGADTPSYNMTNEINFLTIATTGNAQDFGDLTDQTNACGAMSSPTRCVIKLGVAGPGNSTTTNAIDFIQFATTGNATDFGDSVNQTFGVGEGTSNGHGGL